VENRPFTPDWACPPGATIKTVCEDRGISKVDLSVMIGVDLSEIDSLLDGTMEIDDELAAKLATSLGSSQKFWMKREARYREDLISLKKDP
jgi:plasmid maintenance system antidote protein VapI